MECQVYKIYAFTDLHVASGDTSVSAPPLSVCGDTRRRKDFSPFLAQFRSRLVHFLSTSIQTWMTLCACVCGFCVLKWRVVGEGEPSVKREEC